MAMASLVESCTGYLAHPFQKCVADGAFRYVQPEVGLEKADRFMHQVQWEYRPPRWRNRRSTPSPTAGSCLIGSKQLQPDIRGAIASRIAHLMSTRRTSRLFAEINVEVLVDLQAPVL